MIEIWHDLEPIWIDPHSYNFWSSAFPEITFTLLIAAVVYAIWRPFKKHMECHVTGCTNWGQPVHGTVYKACRVHHPAEKAHDKGEKVTVDHIAEAHQSFKEKS